jgi:hypothetical protein
MSLKARGILIVVCVLCGSLCLLGAGPEAAAPAGPAARPMLVEAFVVEVNMPALAQEGVSSIGRQPHAVTVADILKCLDSGQARVIGGNKIASRGQFGAGADVKKTIYVRQERGVPQMTYSPYASGSRLNAEIESVEGATATVKFSFTSARFASAKTGEAVPPTTENWDWSGVVSLRSGEPQIAGATQDGETAIFLLLVVNEQSE